MLSECRSGEELENKFDQGMCFSSLSSALFSSSRLRPVPQRYSLLVDHEYKPTSVLSDRTV
jgi:hypothetical protein